MWRKKRPWHSIKFSSIKGIKFQMGEFLKFICTSRISVKNNRMSISFSLCFLNQLALLISRAMLGNPSVPSSTAFPISVPWTTSGLPGELRGGARQDSATEMPPPWCHGHSWATSKAQDHQSYKTGEGCFEYYLSLVTNYFLIWVVVVHTFHPRTWEAEADRYLWVRVAWSIEWVPRQVGLQSKFQDSWGYTEKCHLKKRIIIT